MKDTGFKTLISATARGAAGKLTALDNCFCRPLPLPNPMCPLGSVTWKTRVSASALLKLRLRGRLTYSCLQTGQASSLLSCIAVMGIARSVVERDPFALLEREG